ncbi:MAG: LL-diaminopimelate aminotransferase, partial [bacterium (Candidatus Ratteibacteria) CG23_combo_of_CG06-09_8_20_14_all_48_7]
FYSFSKTFNMTGWRLGFACGNENLISGLSAVKENLDSGVFDAIQAAGIAALSAPEGFTEGLRQMYHKRIQILVNGLNGCGFSTQTPGGTFYLWLKIPEGNKSADFSSSLLEKFGILTTPGIGFGPDGEGFIRFSVTLSADRIREAINRLE